jgi:hypothetical protein
MIREVILLLLIIPLVSAEQVEDFNDKTDLTLSYTSEGEMNLQGSSGFDYLTAILYLFPRESQRQEVLSLTTTPTSSKTDTDITFTWDSFQEKLIYQLDSEIKTINQIYPVEPASFPIQDLDPQYEQYLAAEEIIDITPEIITKASQLTAGETDLYTAVYKVATWVNEGVEYDLNTLTAEAALQSSWVLQSGEGVCDEITSLFISLLRSVGIPARFVSGTAYSNLNYGFENHGWAEVYFPDQGWVPYDVTFTQFGWIDPGHLELAKSLDAGQTTVKYSWRAQNTELVSSEFNNEPTITKTGNKIQPPFNMQIKTLVNNVGPGSYVPIEVTVENPYDKYLTDTVVITKAPSQLDDNQQAVLLKPSQGKAAYFITQVSSDLNSGYSYTSKIEAKDLFGKRVETELEFASTYDTITKDEAQDMVNDLIESEEKSYSEQLSLTCQSEKNYYYDFEDIIVVCEVKNTGNVFLENVEICLEDDCQRKDMKIGIKEEITFSNVPKQNQLHATAKKDEIDLSTKVNLEVLQEPDLVLIGLKYPNEIRYGEDFELSFVLSSDAIVEDVILKVSGLQNIPIEKTQKAQTFVINTNSKNFVGDTIDITLTYKDEHGREFEINEKAGINVENLPWYAKIIAFFKKLF